MPGGEGLLASVSDAKSLAKDVGYPVILKATAGGGGRGMRIVKGDSSEWINNQALTSSVFRWQEGYGAFSYTKKEIPVVCNYIHNQEEHHKKESFLNEYESLLKDFDIAYQKEYLFHPLID